MMRPTMDKREKYFVLTIVGTTALLLLLFVADVISNLHVIAVLLVMILGSLAFRLVN